MSAAQTLTLGPSAHVDTYTRDHLPPADQWPDLLLDGFDYPDYLNVGVELTDAMVEKGFGDHTALIGNGRRRTYKELADWTNRIARTLVEELVIIHKLQLGLKMYIDYIGELDDYCNIEYFNIC